MMPRLFILFRTCDRIWTCKTLTRELAPFEMDMSGGPIKFVFNIDQLYATQTDGGNLQTQGATRDLEGRYLDSFYYKPHEFFWPFVVQHCKEQSLSSSSKHSLLRRYSVPEVQMNSSLSARKNLSVGDNGLNSKVYFVLPNQRCTLLLDAHTASCLQCEFSRSKIFRRRFLRRLRRGNGFRDCIPDYVNWTEEERRAWEHYLVVPYLIDVVAVWPKQKLDYAWSERILNNLNKHVALEEGFAWLSTLGGAHSSLGETFLTHAQRAGEISSQQLRLAIHLGNESLIARCHVFWAWSLLQRGHFRKCKACVLKTWRFCKSLKGRDKVLENMCKAVWSRLRYRLAVSKGKASMDPGPHGCSGQPFELHDDSSDSGDECERLSRPAGVAPPAEESKKTSSGDSSRMAGSVGEQRRRVVPQHPDCFSRGTRESVRNVAPKQGLLFGVNHGRRMLECRVVCHVSDEQELCESVTRESESCNKVKHSTISAVEVY